MNSVVQSFRVMELPTAAVWCLAINVGLFIIAVACGEVLVLLFRSRRIAPPAKQLALHELILSVSCIVLNSVVMLGGVILLQQGIITIHEEPSVVRSVVDVAVFLVIMDAAMYLLHRIAHVPGIYAIVHRTHHRYENPRPLTLFVLNPFEVLGFGTLWLLVISAYSSTATAMACYLAINLAFGTIGHLGVEPYPKNWSKGYFWWVSTSTFHAQHHETPGTNFGFYTLWWDYLFGTLDRKTFPVDRQL